MSIVEKSNILVWGSDNINSVPAANGVYVLRNLPSTNGIIYIGSSEDIRRRLNEHWSTGDIPEVMWFDWYKTDTISFARELEQIWIAQYSPKYNSQGVG